MSQTQPTPYRATAQELLAKARTALDEGDLIQASEKSWGAAAQAVKAIAQSRGWPHQSHRDLFQAVANIGRESGDERIGALFREASSLHTNFYENWLPADSVAGGLTSVHEFVERLNRLAA